MKIYAIVENNIVVNRTQAESPMADNWIESGIARVGDFWDGESFTAPVVQPLAPEAIQAEIVTATQLRLDNFARTRHYDGILSLCSYATSTSPRFAADGQYGVTARDDTWVALYAILADVIAGTRPIPTGYADIADELPELTWPS